MTNEWQNGEGGSGKEDPIHRFIMNLAAAFMRKVEPKTYDAYYARLARWHLDNYQWAKASSSIISQEETFPRLSQIYPYLKSVKAPGGKDRKSEPTFQLFTVNGLRWARKIDPDNVPDPPTGASNVSIAYPPELQAPERELPADDAPF